MISLIYFFREPVRKNLLKILSTASEKGWVDLEEFRFLQIDDYWPEAIYAQPPELPPGNSSSVQRSTGLELSADNQGIASLLNEVANRIGTSDQMRNVGICLGVPPETIKFLLDANPQSINSAVFEMLYEKWWKISQRTEPEVKAHLQKALSRAGLDLVAEELGLNDHDKFSVEESSIQSYQHQS